MEGSRNPVASNGRVDENGQNGILVTGSSNTIKNNAAGSDKAKGNGQDGFRVSGSGNLLQDNKASANLGNGFTVTATASGTLLKNNQSNTSGSAANKENGGYEFRLYAKAVDQGSNKADGIGIPKTSAPQKCRTFPAAGTTLRIGRRRAGQRRRQEQGGQPSARGRREQPHAVDRAMTKR